MKPLATFSLLGFFFIQGCAFTSQSARLNPELSFKEATTGQGAQVFLSVSDERPDKVIGYRGAGWNGATITTEDDVAVVVQNKISEGLTKKGFNVVVAKTDQTRSLRVDVRELQYLTTMGFFTGGIVTKAALKVMAAYKGDQYEHLYRQEDEDRVLFIPFADDNERQINDTLAAAIAALFRDPTLLQFLAQPGTASAPTTPQASPATPVKPDATNAGLM